MSIRLGVVGAGAIGTVHAEAATAVGLDLACIADPQGDLARELAKKHGDTRSVDDPQAMFDDPQIDAVVIAVPNCFHKDLAIAAMKAGKDVLIEKPMGLDAAQCAEINAVAKATDRIVQVGLVQRFSAVGRSAKTMIDAGELGKIYHAKAHLSRRRGIPGLGGWFTTKALSGGGPLIDVGVHVIDLALYLMGDRSPTRVSGRTYANFGNPIKDYIYEEMWAGPPKEGGVCDVEDAAYALIHFDDGATLDLNVAWAINAPQGALPENLMGFFGDRGGLTFELFGDHLNLTAERHRHNTDVKVSLSSIEMFHEQIRDFARCVETRETPRVSGMAGQRVQSVIDAIYESSASGKEVAVAQVVG